MFHTVRSYFYVLRIYRLFSHFAYIAILLLIFLLLICRSSFKGGGAVSDACCKYAASLFLLCLFPGALRSENIYFPTVSSLLLCMLNTLLHNQ